MTRTALVGFVLWLAVCTGCGGPPGPGPDGGTLPPSDLTYSANPAVYLVGATIDPNAPSAGGDPVDSYSVSPSLPSGLSLDTATGVITGTPTAIAATASYEVTATNRFGSTTATLVCTVDAVPGAPTGVAAVAKPGGIVELSWSAPADVGSSAITSYAVDSTPPGFSTTTSGLGCTSTSLAIGTSYVFSVRALNDAGSGPAAVSSPTIAGDVPSAPTNVVATAPSGRAIATWSASNANGYPVTSYLVVATPGGKSVQVAGGTTTATVTGLTNATMYTLTVSATNALGTGPGAVSNSVTANCSLSTYTLYAVDSTSVDYATQPLLVAAPDIHAFLEIAGLTSADTRGWAKFGLGTVPTWAQVTSMTLYLKVMDVSGSPTPAVEAWYSASDAWNRAMIPQATDIVSGVLLSAAVPPGAVGTFQSFGLLVGARDWSTDLDSADRTLTLGIRNAAGPLAGGSSLASYYGSDLGGNKPVLNLTVCQ